MYPDAIYGPLFIGFAPYAIYVALSGLRCSILNPLNLLNLLNPLNLLNLLNNFSTFSLLLRRF